MKKCTGVKNRISFFPGMTSSEFSGGGISQPQFSYVILFNNYQKLSEYRIIYRPFLIVIKSLILFDNDGFFGVLRFFRVYFRKFLLLYGGMG